MKKLCAQLFCRIYQSSWKIPLERRKWATTRLIRENRKDGKDVDEDEAVKKVGRTPTKQINLQNTLIEQFNCKVFSFRHFSSLWTFFFVSFFSILLCFFFFQTKKLCNQISLLTASSSSSSSPVAVVAVVAGAVHPASLPLLYI